MRLLLIGLWVSVEGFAQDGERQDLVGQWYGVGWDATNEHFSEINAIVFDVGTEQSA